MKIIVSVLAIVTVALLVIIFNTEVVEYATFKSGDTLLVHRSSNFSPEDLGYLFVGDTSNFSITFLENLNMGLLVGKTAMVRGDDLRFDEKAPAGIEEVIERMRKLSPKIQRTGADRVFLSLSGNNNLNSKIAKNYFSKFKKF